MSKIITGAQCKVARTFLKMNESEFARMAGIGKSTLRSIEAENGVSQTAKVQTIHTLHDTFLSTGKIEFIGTDTVRLINPESDK